MTTGKPMTVGCFYQKALAALEAGGFEDPGHEARALIEAVGGLGLADQLAHPGHDLEADRLEVLEEALKLRLQHLPLTKIAGFSWFCGLRFRVNEATLSPRPETEHAVEAALDWVEEGWDFRKPPLRILDTFTGTGALGISLGYRLIQAGQAIDLTLADLSEEALAIARVNAAALLPGVSVRFVLADIWPAEGLYDLVTANPPYIPSEQIDSLMPEVAIHDPRLALDGGSDGLDFYRRLAGEGKSHLSEGGALVLEVGAGQAEEVSQIFHAWRAGARIRDYLGHERVLVFMTESHVK